MSVTNVPLKPQKQLAKYDWEAAENDYIFGSNKNPEGSLIELLYPSYAEVAEKHNIPLQQVKNRAYRYRWSDKRASAQAQRSAELRREHAKRLSNKAIVFDERVYNAADLGAQLIHNRLKDLVRLVGSEMDPNSYENLQEKWITEGKLDMKDFHGTVYFKELAELSKALQQFHDTGRKALGIREDEAPQISIDIRQQNVGAELGRVDKTRIAGIMSVLVRKDVKLPSGFTAAAITAGPESEVDEDDNEDYDDDILEGELVEGEIID